MAKLGATKTKTKTVVARQVVFPIELYSLIEIRLGQLGVSAPEYVRHLVIEDVKPLYQDIPYVDEETELSIGRAVEDIKAGRVTKFKNNSEIQDYLDKLAREAENE